MKTKTLYKSVREEEMIFIIENKKLPMPLEWQKNISLETNKNATIRKAKTYVKHLNFVIELEVPESEYDKLDDKSIDDYEKTLYLAKEKLHDFNQKIIGEIKPIKAFIGSEFNNTKNKEISDLVDKYTKRIKISREEFTLEILELIQKFKYILDHDKSNIYIENPESMIKSMHIRYRRICSIFESIGIHIKNVKHLNNLDFINQYKDYTFADELLPTIKHSLKNFCEVDDVKPENLKNTILQLMQFRNSYISILDNFFGGIQFEGAIPIENRLSTRFVIESIQDIDNLVERINRVITFLLFPTIKEFDVKMLEKKYNFPTENYEIIEHKEFMESWGGF